VNGADLIQVVVIQGPCGDELDEAPRAQGRFPGGTGGHAGGQPVDGHAQATGGGAVHESLGSADLGSVAGFQVRDGLVHADAHIALGDAGGGETLGHMGETALGMRAEAIDLGDGAAHFQGQDLDFLRHGKPLKNRPPRRIPAAIMLVLRRRRGP